MVHRTMTRRRTAAQVEAEARRAADTRQVKFWLTPTEVAELDSVRGEASRSDWFREQIRKAKARDSKRRAAD